MNILNKLLFTAGFLIATCFTLAPVAFAQDSDNEENSMVLEEVIVTAQKREQSLQDVPITVTAFSGEFITENGVQDIRDIQGLTPNLSIKSRGETETSVFIRGIGSQAPGIGADPAVGIFIDGMVASRGTNATAAFFDVERIEVVKGPQGTLFGRNASAGAISIITNKPDLDESYGSVMGGIVGHAGGSCCLHRDSLDCFQQKVPCALCIRAHRDIELGVIGDHIRRRATAKSADRDQRWFEWRHFPRNDRLQRNHDLCADEDRVLTTLRRCAVSRHTVHDDAHSIGA